MLEWKETESRIAAWIDVVNGLCGPSAALVVWTERAPSLQVHTVSQEKQKAEMPKTGSLGLKKALLCAFAFVGNALRD